MDGSLCMRFADNFPCSRNKRLHVYYYLCMQEHINIYLSIDQNDRAQHPRPIRRQSLRQNPNNLCPPQLYQIFYIYPRPNPPLSLAQPPPSPSPSPDSYS